MKPFRFTILLPTRNRLEYLRHAVDSVLRQDDADWEIIISDNDSEEDIRGYVDHLADPRIRYLRTDSFIPVTDNWNNALSAAVGDWVVMLGDDDALRPGYLRELRSAITAHPEAETVITSGLLYAWPGVMPGYPEGFVRDYGYSVFLRGLQGPAYLDPCQADTLVRRFLSFHTEYAYNMQFFCIGRRMIERLAVHGPVFQSPFPDYYAANAIMLAGAPILILPRPLVVIGVTPKSFGWYYVNHQEADGSRFLRDVPDQSLAAELASVVLPGSHLYTSWLYSAETLCRSWRGASALVVDRARYRRLQIIWMHEAIRDGHSGVGREQMAGLVHRLSRREYCLVLMPLRLRTAVRGLVPSPLRRLVRRALRRLLPPPPPPAEAVGWRSITEVVQAPDPLRSP